MLPINETNNQGRDATIEPAYLSRRIVTEEDPESEIAALRRRVVLLEQEVASLQTEYNTVSAELAQATENIESLTAQLNALSEEIATLQEQIAALQEAIAELDDFEPIDNEYINNLPPYNEQEGVG